MSKYTYFAALHHDGTRTGNYYSVETDKINREDLEHLQFTPHIGINNRVNIEVVVDCEDDIYHCYYGERYLEEISKEDFNNILIEAINKIIDISNDEVNNEDSFKPNEKHV